MGVFAVSKKDGSQRLIGDARMANFLHRRAPYAPLSAAGSLAHVSMNHVPDGVVPRGLCVDFQDGFFQFAFPG
eukprot:14431954-Alexandrium_andersonii.AAC.1